MTKKKDWERALDGKTHLILMRKSLRHVSEKDYEFDIGGGGDPMFHLRAQEGVEVGEPWGYA